MKLLIISHMPHHRRGAQVVGWGPTAQEIDALAGLFEEIRHIAILHPEAAPASALPYSSAKVRLIGLPPSGGERWRDKLGILRMAPAYLRAMRRELPWADVVHVRCPANISLMAIVLLGLVRQPVYRWVKYAGNWRPDEAEPWSYTFQRGWLQRGLHRGVATVNGRWPGQPRHVYSFLNPSLSQADLQAGRLAAGQKVFAPPYRLVYAGRLETAKGVGRLLQIAAALRGQDIPFRLDLLGDGPERPAFERQVQELGLAGQVAFHGWLAKPDLSRFYARAHFFVMPTASEGWPKVLSEAASFGVVAVAGAVSSVPQILEQTGMGVALSPYDPAGFAAAIRSYIARPEEWQAASQAGLDAAPQFTYDAYLQAVRKMFQAAWGITLPAAAGPVISSS